MIKAHTSISGYSLYNIAGSFTLIHTFVWKFSDNWFQNHTPYTKGRGWGHTRQLCCYNNATKLQATHCTVCHRRYLLHATTNCRTQHASQNRPALSNHYRTVYGDLLKCLCEILQVWRLNLMWSFLAYSLVSEQHHRKWERQFYRTIHRLSL